MPALKEDDDQLVFIPEDQLTTPPEGLIEHLKDYWWLVFIPEDQLTTPPEAEGTAGQ